MEDQLVVVVLVAVPLAQLCDVSAFGQMFRARILVLTAMSVHAHIHYYPWFLLIILRRYSIL